jgi:hypothetical protein
VAGEASRAQILFGRQVNHRVAKKLIGGERPEIDRTGMVTGATRNFVETTDHFARIGHLKIVLIYAWRLRLSALS